MHEADFQAEVARSIPWLAEQLGRPVAYVKIPDAIARGAEWKFAARRGYDAFLVDQGRHVAIEYKLCKKPSLPFDALDPYQERCLLEVEAAGGSAWILVGFRLTFSTREAARRGDSRMIAAFAVRAGQWGRARADACRSSLALEWFEAEAVRVDCLRLQQGFGWDLRPLLGIEGERVEIPQAVVVAPARRRQSEVPDWIEGETLGPARRMAQPSEPRAHARHAEQLLLGDGA